MASQPRAPGQAFEQFQGLGLRNEEGRRKWRWGHLFQEGGSEEREPRGEVGSGHSG